MVDFNSYAIQPIDTSKPLIISQQNGIKARLQGVASQVTLYLNEL
jgi:hypothetical protein